MLCYYQTNQMNQAEYIVFHLYFFIPKAIIFLNIFENLQLIEDKYYLYQTFITIFESLVSYIYKLFYLHFLWSSWLNWKDTCTFILGNLSVPTDSKFPALNFFLADNGKKKKKFITDICSPLRNKSKKQNFELVPGEKLVHFYPS